MILFSETAFQVTAWGIKGKAALSWRTQGFSQRVSSACPILALAPLRHSCASHTPQEAETLGQVTQVASGLQKS